MNIGDMPAFPHPSGAQGTEGLTKREYFAITLLAGINQGSSLFLKLTKKEAVELADELISELAKEK